MKRLHSIFLLGAIVLGVTPASAVIIPFGPQNDISSATVAGWGWSECYVATYADPLGDDIVDELSQCPGDLLMLAARPTGSNVFDVLAAAPRADILFNTGINEDVVHVANGSSWYYAPTWSVGFAGLGDDVIKFQCDIAGQDERDRLCWHLVPGVGGFRSGSNIELNASTDWEKVILIADAPEPAALGLFGLGVLGLVKIKRHRRTSYPGPKA